MDGTCESRHGAVSCEQECDHISALASRMYHFDGASPLFGALFAGRCGARWASWDHGSVVEEAESQLQFLGFPR